MMIRWGPGLVFLFLLFSIPFHAGELTAGNPSTSDRAMSGFKPITLTTQPLIVTGVYRKGPGGTTVIATKKLMVSGFEQDRTFRGITISTKVLMVTGKHE